jgi:molybdopterin converting factor small subunit
MEAVKVSFIGIFSGLAGKTEARIKVKGLRTVDWLIRKIVKEVGKIEFKRALIDPELNDPKPNAVILVNGREIAALNGLKTKLRNGDEVVLIPVTHGG